MDNLLKAIHEARLQAFLDQQHALDTDNARDFDMFTDLYEALCNLETMAVELANSR